MEKTRSSFPKPPRSERFSAASIQPAGQRIKAAAPTAAEQEKRRHVLHR
ncbi:hypothetical protein CLOLEP_00915 [[Clostridium] leptum DSM 753]|uniref:Uncharacterized protein n=1 Tax=[Clostridium] leptum DSM 753 TaxID=428125 RepID=A7VQT3_9FIRM|nr:hypothetical protein CLOLEP_00915 [[Clostridium] leptum DSM 753]